MQSSTRRATRINSGQQNPASSSTKINRHTQAMGIDFGGDRYRKGRFARAIFNIPLKGVRNYSSQLDQQTYQYW